MISTLAVVVRGSLRALDDGYAVDVQASSGMPLSTDLVRSARIALDGQWASGHQTVLACTDGFRTAALEVHGVPRPVPGTDHHVAVELVYASAEAHADRWVTVETAA